MSKKLLTLVAAGALTMTLAACGNNNVAKDNTSHHSDHTEKVVKATSSSAAKRQSTGATSASGQTSTQKAAANNYTVKANDSSSSKATAKSDSSTRAPMTAQDAKNIVKEHILAKLNDAGINGQPRPDVPSMDEIDGYTATQNGVNDWTVTGNGHTYHVTATSVTEE